ncbi:MAG: hexitol phosphatase HxpB [Marinifilaceae bacterium]
MIKAAIFDMDGLLINSEPFWRRSEKRVFSNLGITLKDEMFEQFMGKRIDEVVATLYRQFPWSGVSQKEVAGQIVEGVIQLVLEEGEALKGVYQTLKLLKHLNIKLALASSSYLKIITAVLEKLEIADYFEVVHSAEFEKYGKPHPQIFITTAQKLEVDPEECIVFEDSFNGVIAALAANMKCVAVPDPEFGEQDKFKIANLVLNNLEEFSLAHLEMLNEGPIGTKEPKAN